MNRINYDKNEIKKKLKGGIIAVIRHKDKEVAKEISKTLIKGGVSAIEVTFSVDEADQVIKSLKEEFEDAIIGAGTVLTKEDAKKAIDCGADFIVSPCVIEEVAKYTASKEVLLSMGAATPTEVYNAYMLGSDIVKLFPGEFLSPGFIKAIKAPMPFIDVMPTGGVTHKNIAEWFENGAYAAGFGGYISNGIDMSNLELLNERVDALKKALEDAKNE